MYLTFSFEGRMISIQGRILGYDFDLSPHTCPNCAPWEYPNSPQYASYVYTQKLATEGVKDVPEGYACLKCGDLIMSNPLAPIDFSDLALVARGHVCEEATSPAE